MYKKISGLVVSLTAVFACAAWAEVPAGYPADYQKTIDAAVGNDSNLLIVFYVQIMPDDFVMQLHRF